MVTKLCGVDHAPEYLKGTLQALRGVEQGASIALEISPEILALFEDCHEHGKTEQKIRSYAKGLIREAVAKAAKLVGLKVSGKVTVSWQRRAGGGFMFFYKIFEALTNQTNDETFNQLLQKMTYYKQLADEAFIMADIEIKKQDVWTKQRRIKQDLNRHNMYELPNRTNRYGLRRNN